MRAIVTGGAGFIGSHLVDKLLALKWEVVVIDNFATGDRRNLPENHPKLQVLNRDITVDSLDFGAADIVFHQAALPSVPRSMADPMATFATNVHGTLRVLEHARQSNVKRVVFASSSSIYGDAASALRHESVTGAPLSPYAASKQMGETAALGYAMAYGIDVVGLRYFNVFGPRQNPNGGYSAVIPRWCKRLLTGEPCVMYGDGSTVRDFTYVSNVVAANLLAATTKYVNVMYNVAMGKGTTLLKLSELLEEQLTLSERKHVKWAQEARRPGDISRSVADIKRARHWLGYKPGTGLQDGLRWTLRAMRRGVVE